MKDPYPLHLRSSLFFGIYVQIEGQLLAQSNYSKKFGEKYFSSNNTVMVHIRHLREKMKDAAENPKYIKTVWGVGYTIEK